MIIVTGASRGLGAAIYARLAMHGLRVLGVSRSISEDALGMERCDVGSYNDVRTLSRRIRQCGEPVEGLINAAGVASMNLALMMPPHMTEALVRTNLLGTIHCCQCLTPLMVRRRTGRIINFSTIAVALALKGEAVYAASKAGVEAFSRAFAREVAEFGITVNCIAPGPIRTGLLHGVTDAQIEHIVSQQIIPHEFSPDAVCDLTELLLDRRADAISGQVLHVGGY
ncbi:SDR family NAD(P)-dependent oxidoreductase [Desulfovibrio sp. ZJ369]|uniref:SDR family NAD(P)-dependent oxidoreductase n=1 Tax=Desulfovibrio sp. ZJ369 TaxID=2709793 RepID=UPI0013EDF0BD|nr:SDR family NAD(P)-dependent oxidoreductase [Desulfovibrio sp. ZJ369]